jgi:hypothetical protein
VTLPLSSLLRAAVRRCLHQGQEFGIVPIQEAVRAGNGTLSFIIMSAVRPSNRRWQLL